MLLKAQETNVIGLEEGDLTGCEIVRHEVYNGTSLWGLINGGADVYFEYGFTSLLLQEVKKGDTDFRIEIYKMADPESAFGIYMMSCFKCQKRNDLLRLNCSNPYQFQTVRGDFYISIINDSGRKEDQEFSNQIAKNIVNKIEDKQPEFPGILKNEFFKPYFDRLKYFKGPLGLQNGYSSLSESFEAYSGYKFYLLAVEDNVSVSIINFASEDNCNNYMKELINNYSGKDFGKTESEEGNIKVFRKQDEKSLTVLEYNRENTSSESFISVVEKLISEGE